MNCKGILASTKADFQRLRIVLAIIDVAHQLVDDSFTIMVGDEPIKLIDLLFRSLFFAIDLMETLAQTLFAQIMGPIKKPIGLLISF